MNITLKDMSTNFEQPYLTNIIFGLVVCLTTITLIYLTINLDMI
jgi:hypothetical protein